MNEHDEELLDRLMADRNDPCGFSATPGSPLAKARARAHQQFDALWKNGHMTRKRAYRWLGRRMKIPPSDCHIILFDIDQCEQVIKLCRRRVLELEAE
jgi:hypothetical protein